MLGYVRAYKPEMKFKDFDLYKGVYCSLCKEIGRRYGLIARLTLSYDFTFFALMRMALRKEDLCLTKSHCSFNPAKKCLDCGLDNKDIEYTADISMLMLYHKTADNINDSKLLKKLIFKIALPYIKHIYKKACANVENEAKLMQNYMELQSKAEKDNLGIDEAAEPSARILSELLASGAESNDEQALKRTGYFIGRWVYLIDAIDDCQSDIKSGNFNPLKDKFNDSDFNDYCERLLNLTIGEAVNSYKLLKIYRFNDILNNIIYDGTFAVMNKVIKKEALK